MSPRSLALLALLAVGCRNTSCEDEATMRNPRLAGPLDTTTSRDLVIVWDPGRELPASYFDEVGFGREPGIEAVTHTAERELTVTFEPDTVPQRFTLELQDRRKFIDCSHPGSDDTYLIEVTLQLSGDVVVDASFREDIDLGPI